MSNDKSTAKSTTASSAIPFMIGVEWAKPLSEIPGKFYGELLNFTSRRLQAQAEFVQNLATCKNPADLLKHQANFYQTAFREYSEEAANSWKDLLNGATIAHGKS